LNAVFVADKRAAVSFVFDRRRVTAVAAPLSSKMNRTAWHQRASQYAYRQTVGNAV